LPLDLARVKEIMTMNAKIPRVTTETTVLEATNLMNEKGTSAVVVIDGDDKVVGFFGERTLLTEFVRLNKKPEEVKVGKIMHLLYRIEPEATTKEAARAIVENGATRLGVYDGDSFLGWVTLTDLSRDFSRESLLDRLRSHNVPEVSEVRCPNCNKAFMEKVTNSEGVIVRWQCPNCKYAL
jgi:signal-transduction protein with cAMP-binding, CBS, and nucleotidyltransferase domain